MKKLFFRCVLAGLIVLPASLCADTIIEEIVARVNNSIITRSEYLRSKEQLRQEAQQQDPTNASKVIAEREKDVLRDLIDQQLLLQKGTDMGISADTDVIKKLDEMRKQMKLDSMEELEKAAQAQGISFEDYKQNMKNQIITQQVIGKEIGSKIGASISKEDQLKFYNAHKSDLEQPEQVQLSELLISTEKKAGDTSTDEQRLAAAQAKADDLIAQIRKGASFEDLAKKNSNGPTADQGGDLGYFKRGTLAPSLEEKVFALKAGEVSDAVRTKQGFVILKVSEHTKAGVPPFSEIEPRIMDAMYMEKLQPALRAYLTKLREEAYIKISSGYVDSGASAKQTAPVETTVQEANAKELTKKKKKLGVF